MATDKEYLKHFMVDETGANQYSIAWKNRSGYLPSLKTEDHNFWIDEILFEDGGDLRFDINIDINSDERRMAHTEAEENGWLDEFAEYGDNFMSCVSIKDGKLEYCDSGFTEAKGAEWENEDAKVFLLSGASEALYFNSISIDNDLPKLEEFIKQLLKDLTQCKEVPENFKEAVEDVLAEEDKEM